jgi:hypothetical protein
MPIRGMYGAWISGSHVNSFCCYGLRSFPSGFLVVLEKPNRSSFTSTFAFTLHTWVRGPRTSSAHIFSKQSHRVHAGPPLPPFLDRSMSTDRQENFSRVTDTCKCTCRCKSKSTSKCK